MTDKIKDYEDEHAVNYRLRFKGDAQDTTPLNGGTTQWSEPLFFDERSIPEQQNGGDEPPDDGFYRVKIRKDLARVKEGAHLIDGKVFEFKAGWQVDTGTMYDGEWAMMPVDLKSWPHESCIAWIASGDLEYAGENDTPIYTREELVDIASNAYAIDQFENQDENTGCCTESMQAALDALIAIDAVRTK